MTTACTANVKEESNNVHSVERLKRNGGLKIRTDKQTDGHIDRYIPFKPWNKKYIFLSFIDFKYESGFSGTYILILPKGVMLSRPVILVYPSLAMFVFYDDLLSKDHVNYVWQWWQSTNKPI